MDTAGDKELMISAWPYTQLDITLGREGRPSNTVDQPDHLEIVDVVRDDLRTIIPEERRALRRGHAAWIESWLKDILTTWRFTD